MLCRVTGPFVESQQAPAQRAERGRFAPLLLDAARVTGKGLAGYMDTSSGQHLILALYVNMVSVSLEEAEAAQKIAGEALGEVASAAFDAPLAAWTNGSEAAAKPRGDPHN